MDSGNKMGLDQPLVQTKWIAGSGDENDQPIHSKVFLNYTVIYILIVKERATGLPVNDY